MTENNLLSENLNDWIEVGTIVAPQGLQGELRVISNSDFSERFEKPGTRWLQSPQGLYTQEVELVRGRYVPGKKLYIIQLAQVKDRTQADALRDYKLVVSKSDRPKIEEGEYYVSDLINLGVYHQETGELIGNVTDILWAGHDLLEVKLYQKNIQKELEISKYSPKTTSRKKQKNKIKKTKIATILIPFVYEIVPVVDLENKRIEINPPVGLLELNQ
ncbi:ribosome maturation factor RimM [cyanobacterium endosymbiont of Epithemia clementina EcSB]|uniref:ribosome maturation factor RimM n=1 Tax=cyanobacterium endosymbiont of Epithemia clementina EcSB TaxID=3034674 RepID=UPI00247FAE9F|nr:ribosome maturation factor RimM [cyanobacterium endosymbiont of Epithemia clementina EcSB]WGT66763.1 ribosome maturation factor RimM [cyanobacterium endosymbiont of Epithemia clementina EcSB]